MFNREVQVRFVKKNRKNNEVVESSEVDVEEVVKSVNEVFDNMIKKIAMAALGYVVIDTGRKILVAKVSK